MTYQHFFQEHSPDNLPKEYDPEQLPKFSVDQIIWFNETHIQLEGDQVSWGGVQIRFPQDANGAFPASLEVPTDGMYSAPLHKPIFKYANEARFCLGICVIEDANGEYIGKKQKPFLTL